MHIFSAANRRSLEEASVLGLCSIRDGKIVTDIDGPHSDAFVCFRFVLTNDAKIEKMASDVAANMAFKDMTESLVLGYRGKSVVDVGYFYAPRVSLHIIPDDGFEFVLGDTILVNSDCDGWVFCKSGKVISPSPFNLYIEDCNMLLSLIKEYTNEVGE